MLWRKMFRDLNENKGAYIACIAIVAIGLMMFTSFSIVMDNLLASQENFYYYEKFADGFAEMQSMPYSEVDKLRSLEGINEIQGRLIKEVRVIFPGREDNVYLRLISVDPENNAPINGVRLDKGTPLKSGEMNIWLDNMFFDANKLELDQKIEIIAEGKKKELRIAGAGKNPEFIYAMRTPSDMFPTPDTFGIAYIPFETMKNLFQEKGTVNSIIFTLKPGADYKEVEDRLKPELKPYGLKSIYSRKNQPSHVLLTEELEQLNNMSKSLPLVFLCVASTIMYIMLKRTIEKQRGQIGILKALGYNNKEISFHYMSYALTIGTFGGIIGGLLGIWLSFFFTDMYQMFFNMPGLAGEFSLSYLFISIILSLVFSVFAGFQGCKNALILEPAEAMRPPAPPSGKSTLIEKVALFWSMLTVQGKMAVRNVFRHRGRSIFVFLGIMFTFALLASPWSMWDLSQEMLFDQFEKVEIYDIKISLAQPLNQKKAERELQHFPGVNRVECRAEIPVTLKNGWHKKDVALLGIPANSQLHRILDSSKNQVEPPANGILLSERLAQLLDAQVGTELNLESIMLKDPEAVKKIVVAGIIPQYLGLNAYMELTSLQSLLEQGDLATTIMLKIDEKAVPLLQEKYKNSAVINGVEDRIKLLRQSMELMGSFTGTIFVMLLIGVITGFAIIYNSSIITLSERSRELASMMVLGMTPSEVLSVITFEQWFLAIFGMAAGIPLTKLLLVGLAQSVNNDVYTMPVILSNMSILAGFAVTILSIWVAQRMAARKIRSLQMVDVLKARE